MKSIKQINQIAQRTINNELNAIKNLKSQITDDFAKAVILIYESTGRVIITGIGKSANIATKIVATLNSTGIPSIFMHAADAIHGDLGTIRKDDVIICISNSGNTSEIKILVPLIKIRGNKVIAFTGNLDSFLSKQADYVINTTVSMEACPNNLVPTSSTTAQLVMGDALAVALLECRGFTVNDFAKYHPGGAIGKKLYLKVADLYINNAVPLVNVNDDIKSTIVEISSKRLGATAVLDNGKLVGIITDGDLRRMLEKSSSIENINAGDIMTPNPKTLDKNILVIDALTIMRKNNITQILVLDGTKYVGVIHLHDILREGIL
ncbi:MAG: KpsF/GutQ family sugar-phosphate isomerase [Bacteroidetes bacterium]|nr:KpsF/GutQ family sugar-phosphate isomerase [Bacteroidota bacterium]MBL7104540.1 KpsF/GutQ family sugar-phosphate isomerase [Bacteroidales bacterium]